MKYTLTYNKNVEGWTSFFSYHPEMMLGMNGSFYSFKGGELYKHNTNVNRNTFYQDWWNRVDNVVPPAISPNAFEPSKVTSVFNKEPLTIKNFKTIATYGNSPWNCTVITDLSTGNIDSSYFVEKEGNWFAYIRSLSGDNNLKLRSAQGVGSVDTVDDPGTASTILNFTFNIGTIVSVGDLAYRNDAGSIEFIGAVTGFTNTSITINNTPPLANPVNDGDYILYIKNSVAESYGARGYYMQYELENGSNNRVELFSVKSNVFKSYP
jgi:hypothetical protein